MENNEQVFFDIQSCQFETFSDLTTILHTGDRLFFNAIIGPRDGSTKWRSLKTWIKMRPQPNSSGGSNNMICTLDNMSSHSDADKSDDSSTSSQGAPLANGAFGNNLRRRGNFYPNGQQTTSSPVGNSSQNNQMLQSNSNLSLDNESSSTNNESQNVNQTSGGVHASLSGDFNLYQLDNGDNSGANSATGGGTIDENTELLISSTHSSNQLIHSTSANNLQSMLQSHQIAEAHAKASAAVSACSKSVHSFNSLTPPNEHSLEDVHLDSSKTPSSTKFMKQSADNISERETSQVNPKMVSMACQTFSTGDITVSNVYIE